MQKVPVLRYASITNAHIAGKETKMDEWAFITLAKTKSDLLTRKDAPLKEQPTKVLQHSSALSKIDAALALDYEEAERNPTFRGAVALAVAALVNVAFFGGIELTALNARTPSGEVVVAEVERVSHDLVTASL
jgi:hypothetical protein